jgi:hypothetical protein
MTSGRSVDEYWARLKVQAAAPPPGRLCRSTQQLAASCKAVVSCQEATLQVVVEDAGALLASSTPSELPDNVQHQANRMVELLKSQEVQQRVQGAKGLQVGQHRAVHAGHGLPPASAPPCNEP